MLLEKYLTAAKIIVSRAVPMVPKVVADRVIPGRDFVPAAGAKASAASGTPWRSLSYYEPARAVNAFRAEHAGRYRLLVDLTANEKFVDGVFDYNKCRLILRADGKVVLDREYGRQGGKPFHYELDQDWPAGEHQLASELEPLTPKEKRVRALALRVVSVTVRGPLEKEHWVRPANYSKFFPEKLPEDAAGRRAAAKAILAKFADKAFRRPADPVVVNKLVALAESTYSAPGQSFEAGVAKAMTAVLASPRFLFRTEDTQAAKPGEHPLVDEFALASRSSYFFWSSVG